MKKMFLDLGDGISIPISRRKRQEFIHRFHQFLGV